MRYQIITALLLLVALVATPLVAQPVVFPSGGTVTPPPGQLGYYPAGGPGAYAPTVTAVPSNLPALPPCFEGAVGQFAGFGFLNSNAVDVSVQSIGGYTDIDQSVTPSQWRTTSIGYR